MDCKLAIPKDKSTQMVYIVPQMEQLTRTTLDPQDLLLFARVVEWGGFGRTADRLGLPKSTVSRRVASLEKHLGERLLLRTTRRQTVTEFGQLLLEHARQVVAEVEAVQALREHRQSAPSGRLRVSMPSDFANLLLADALAAFVALHPAIQLELDLSPRRVDLLGEGYDVAIRMGDLPDDNLLAARQLATFPSGLYAAPSYLVEHGVPTQPEDLLQHHGVCLLSGRGGAAPWHLVRGSAHWEGTPLRRMAANSPELLIQLVKAGVGVAAAPDHFAQPGVREGRLRRVLPDWCLPSATAWVVFPGRRLMPAKTRAFIGMLQTTLGPSSESPHTLAAPPK